MKPARVLIFDDHEKVLDSLTMFMTAFEHDVVGTAATVDEAKSLIESMEPDTADVALVDGSFNDGRTGNESGAIITDTLRAAFGDQVKIIGISASGDVVGVDVNIPKTDANGIVSYIEAL